MIVANDGVIEWTKLSSTCLPFARPGNEIDSTGLVKLMSLFFVIAEYIRTPENSVSSNASGATELVNKFTSKGASCSDDCAEPEVPSKDENPCAPAIGAEIKPAKDSFCTDPHVQPRISSFGFSHPTLVVRRLLGAGKVGRVYEATHDRSVVAIKSFTDEEYFEIELDFLQYLAKTGRLCQAGCNQTPVHL